MSWEIQIISRILRSTLYKVKNSLVLFFLLKYLQVFNIIKHLIKTCESAFSFLTERKKHYNRIWLSVIKNIQRTLKKKNFVTRFIERNTMLYLPWLHADLNILKRKKICIYKNSNKTHKLHRLLFFFFIESFDLNENNLLFITLVLCMGKHFIRFNRQLGENKKIFYKYDHNLKKKKKCEKV